jgi:hypothetical protein
MSDEARIEAAARMLAEWDRAGYWVEAKEPYRTVYRNFAKQLLAAADAVGETVTVSRDDLRTVLDLAELGRGDCWGDEESGSTLDRLRAIVEAN